MEIINKIITFCLIINYGKLIFNLIKGTYKNNFKNIFIDLVIAYYLAPILTIAIIWDWVKKRK